MRTALTAFLLSVVVAAVASAGVLSPGLERRMLFMDGDEEIRVLVVMKDQVDVKALSEGLRAAKAGRETRHQRVVGDLRETARASQRDLLADLAGKTGHRARGFTSHWLVNSVFVVTTVGHVRELAARDDVEVVEPDLQVELIEPLPSAKTAPDKAEATGIGLAPGLNAVNAPRVWSELGIDGSGVIVGVLDTGVDGDHPALASRWRGNVAPADECWLDAAALGDTLPVDQHYHGTHVMGTITGLAPDDTIGVAPGALWIASNIINAPDTGPDFDNGVLASLEFMADPDGDPLTSDDVPDVVQNSWGVNEDYAGYVDCDSRWWSAIDACEAAGVVLTWSAGNEGPGGGTVRSPADRATTALNAFSVGSTINTAPFTVSEFSSRGPSGCGGEFAVKPEVVAPGTDIYSAEPGGGYQYLSGTSMAGPHVAGVVALMRQADPSLDVLTIKQILIDTAVDLGPAGEENDYGHGMVDAYAAVLAVMNGYGSVEGVVSDDASGLPVPRASLTASTSGEQDRHVTADAAGAYRFMLPEGSWTVTASGFGYLDGDATAAVVADDTTVVDVDLTLAPHATVSGTVLLPDGSPAAEAVVEALDTPAAPAATDSLGFYALSLPVGGAFELQARQAGFKGDRNPVTVNGDLTVDFQLGVQTHEDFETGDFTNYPWAMSGGAPWTIDAASTYEGTYAARTGGIAHDDTTTMTTTLDLDEGEFSFWYRVSSEKGFDFLRFSVDGSVRATWSGDVPWTRHVIALTAGEHELSWTYIKDGDVSTGADAAWVDFIGAPLYPEIAAAPSALDETLAPGASVQRTVTVTNTGLADLEVTVWTSTGSPTTATAAPRATHGKDEPDLRTGASTLLGSGGPDGYGYDWIDSDEPGGPAFTWYEIAAIGDAHVLGDDDATAVPLPFAFPFYGADYDTAYVSSNGFLCFAEAANDYANAGIPSADAPDALIAPFWDDLDPTSGGGVFSHEVEPGRFVIEWSEVRHYDGGGAGLPVTFQVVLEADGAILCNYLTMNDVESATVGVENATGDDGLQVVFNAPYLHDDLTIRFDFVQPWLAVAPASLTVPAGGSADLTVTFDAADLVDGVYAGQLNLASNDPDQPLVALPVALTVATGTGVDVGPPALAFHLGAASPNPFNPSTTIAFELPADGGPVRLDVYDVSGRLVRRLVADDLPGGRHEATWCGDDEAGRRAASGTYVAMLRCGGLARTTKLQLVK